MNDIADSHAVLGVEPGATVEEIRQVYLAKVRDNPPEREPEKFREIHAAYQRLSDPLVQAEALVRPPRQQPNLTEIIDAAAQQRPPLPKLVLLALGNRPRESATPQVPRA
jgi:hypothetical protein